MQRNAPRPTRLDGFSAVSRSTLRRSLPLLLAMLAACSAYHPGEDLSYLVDLTADGASQIDVTLNLKNVTQRTLDLVGCADEGVLKISDFTPTDEHGAPVRFSASVDTVGSRGERIAAPRFTLRGVATSAVTVRYQISPGVREGNSHMGFTGRSFGNKGRAFGFTTGRQIFLVPDAAVPVRAIAVHFLAPAGGKIAVPWPRRGDGWAPGVSGADPRDHLVSAALAWGDLCERVIPMGATRLRLTYEKNAQGTPTDRDVAALQQCARFVRNLFGRDLGPEYTVLLAGATPDGDELVGEGWGTGQGGTLLPISGRTMRTFSQRLIDAYVLYPPYRATLHDPKQYWLIDAARNWYAWRAVEAAGLVDEAQIDGDLAQGYYAAFDVKGVDRNLESLYESKVPNPIAQGGIAPVVLRYLDWSLRNERSRAAGVDAVIPRIFDRRASASLWDLLPGGSASWSRFRKDFVQGLDVIPVSRLGQVSPTRPHPSVPRGESAKLLTLLYTGNSQGYLETCGCKVNQSGGIARRATILHRTRAADAEAIVLDAGNLFARITGLHAPDSLARLEQRFFLQTMDEMRYQAASVGSMELEQGARELATQVANLRTPFLGANIETGQPWSPRPFVILRAHGLRIGVIGVLEPPTGEGDGMALDRALRTVAVRAPVAAVARTASDLRSRVDLLVVMGEIRPVTIRSLIRKCPDIDIVISTRDDMPIGVWNARAKQLQVERHDKSGFIDSTLVLYASLDQYGVHQVRLRVGADRRIVGVDIEEIWLREDVPDDPRVRDELSRFYELVARGASAHSEVRGPLAGVAWKTGRSYLGAGRCASCHKAEYAQWKTTAHASAYKTLLDRHRHFQPRCVSCHVVGYGEATGYTFGDREEPLGNVQCEVCHGPGGEHAIAPSRINIVRAVPERICLACHNEEHSEAFVYADRIGEVNHTHGLNGAMSSSVK